MEACQQEAPESPPQQTQHNETELIPLSHILTPFITFAILTLTCSFALLAPGFAGSSCTTTEQLRQSMSSYDPWPLSELLTINLGFGTMAFSTAKLVDVFWDVVVGRGGQVLLTYVAYSIFTKSLARAMERSQVSYHTFAAFAFEPGTAAGVFMLAKNFASNRSLRNRMIISWVLIATLYIIAFPTLLSAMTGYTSVMGAYIEDKSHNLVPWESYSRLAFIIEDADRIPHFQRRTPVPPGSSDLLHATINYIRAYNVSYNPTFSSIFNISNNTYHLGPPLLNITDGARSEFYIYQNDTSFVYDSVWIKSHISCQPMGSTYQWGFSFILTFIVCVLTTVWSIGMHAMWMDAHENSRIDRSGRKLGGMFWSVINLATAIRDDLGEEVNQYSNSELETRLKRSKGGVNVPSDELPLSRMEERRKRWKIGKGDGTTLKN